MSYDIRFDVVQTGAETIDQITAKMTVMKAQITATSLEMRQAGNRIADAQKQVEAGTTGLSASLAKQRAELDGLVAKQREQKAALSEMAAATDNAASSARKHATEIVALGAAHAAMVPQVTAASAAIRTMFGDQSIRAVERFAVTTLGLGPILQKIFPVVGVLAFADMLGHAAEKVYKLWQEFDPLTKAIKAADEEAKSLDQTLSTIGAQIKSFDAAQFARAFGAAAGYLHQAALAQGDLQAQDNAIKLTKDQIAAKKADITELSTMQAGNEQPDQRSVDAAKKELETLQRNLFQQQLIRQNSGNAVTTLNQQGIDIYQAEKDKRDQDAKSSAERAANKQAEENKRAQGEVDSDTEKTIGDPVERAKYAANARAMSFPPGANRDRVLASGQADVAAAAKAEDARKAKERDDADNQLAELNESFADRAVRSHELNVTAGRESDRKRDEQDKRRQDLADSENEKTGAASVKSLTSAGSSADKLTSLNPQLTDAQKISAITLQDLATADAIYQVKAQTALLEIDGAKQDKLRNDADLEHENEIQKIREANQDKIAALAEKQIADFRSTVGGLFDALVSHTPRAIPNFVKSQVLGQAQTFTENAAQQFLLPVMQSVGKATGINSALTKGTWFEGGAGKNAPIISAADRTTAAVGLVRDEVGKLVALQTGRADPDVPGSGSVIGSAAPGSPASGGGNYDIYSQAGIDPSYTGTQATTMAAMAALATSPSGGGGGVVASLAKALGGNFGLGVGSVMNGNALSVLMGNNPLNANGVATSTTTTASQVGAGLALTGALAGGGFEIYQGLKQGGVGGDLKAAGAAVGTGTMLASNVSKLLGDTLPTILGASIPVIGSLVAMALPLIGGLFNGPQQRTNAINTELGAAQYIAPVALNATQDSSGNFTDFDARGNIRTSNFSAIPQVREGSVWEQTHGLFDGPPTFYSVPGGQTSQFGAASAPVTVHNYAAGAIQTIDATSFSGLLNRNSRGVGDAAAKAMQNGHGGLTTEVQRASNP